MFWRSHLAYSSLMIFSTRLIMLPTVVSEGWAAVILLPSLRIISIRSPEIEKMFVKDQNLGIEYFLYMILHQQPFFSHMFNMLHMYILYCLAVRKAYFSCTTALYQI